jgi:hypothetical protein
MSPSETSNAPRLTDHAIGEVAVSHRTGRHGSHIEHLARERISARRHSIKHHPKT